MDKYYLRKEWQKKIGIVTGVYYVLIIFLNFVLIMNKTNKLQEFDKQREILIREQRFVSIIQSVPEEVKGFIQEIKRSLEEKQQFFQIIETISKNVGVKVKDVRETQLTGQESQEGMSKSYSLNFVSSFKKIGEFILLLEKQPNFVVKNLTISSGRKEALHNVEIVVEVYNL